MLLARALLLAAAAGPFDLSSATYSGRSFSVGGQETAPQALAFSSAGDRVYVLGNATNTVYEYELSTPWQIDTASYSTRSFSVASQETIATGLAFGPAGDRMYVVGQDTDAVYEYALSTAWKIDTASYTGRSFSIASQETTPRGLAFSPAGDRLYVIGFGGSGYEYELSTPWQIDTASYSGRSFSFASQDNGLGGIQFLQDGEILVVVASTGDAAYQYAVAMPWQIDTAAYSSRSVSVSGQEATPTDIAFSSDLSRMYVVGGDADTVFEYEL